MMYLFIMINISVFSREVVGRITTSTDVIGGVVQLTCTSDVNGSCTKGSWLSKTLVTLGSCFQGCKSNIGVENKFHSNVTSLTATIANWNWTEDNRIWKCQCDAETAEIVVTLPHNTTTTVAPLLEHPTTVAPLLENANSTVTSSSENNTGPIIGGVIGSLLGVALIAFIIYIKCFQKNEGRCLTRRRCCLKQKPKKRDAVSKVEEGLCEEETLMTKHDRTLLNDCDPGSAGHVANSVINGDAKSYSSEIEETDISDSKAESGRTLARQDLGFDQKVPDVEKEMSKVSTSSVVESPATSPISQASYQLHTDLKNGREQASLQKGSAGLPISESEVRDQIRRSNWEKGEIDYMDKDAFSNIQQKLDESLNKTTYSPYQRESSIPYSNGNQLRKTTADNVL